jgi:hypothetical protein
MKYKQSMIKKMFNDSQITDEHYKKFYDVVETLEID